MSKYITIKTLRNLSKRHLSRKNKKLSLILLSATTSFIISLNLKKLKFLKNLELYSSLKQKKIMFNKKE